MSEEVVSEPAYRVLVRRIESLIMSGTLGVGQALLAETALAKQFGVNRSTVREAIRALEQNGLVRRRKGGKRLLVSAPDGSHITPRLAAAMVLQEVSFHELWDAMYCLEPAIASAAAEQVKPDAFAALEKNLERTSEGLTDWRRLVELDIEFHDLISKASNNRALQLCREPISQLFYPAFAKVMSRLNAGERLLVAHRRIVDALRANNGQEARDWMDKHIVDFRRGYELANLDIAKPVVWPDREAISAKATEIAFLSDRNSNGTRQRRARK